MNVSGNPDDRRFEKKEVKTKNSTRYTPSKARKNYLTGGVYPVAIIFRLRVEQALFGRGERI